MTSSQVSRRFFQDQVPDCADPEARARLVANADRYANRSTLRPLKDLQLIQAVRPWLRGAGAELCRKETHVLTAAGAEIVRAHFTSEGKGQLRWTSASGEIDGTNQAHAEAIVDVAIAFERTVGDPLRLWGWRDDRELARMAAEGESLFRRGVPDALFVISAPTSDGHRHLPCFVEIDRATETVWASDGRGRDWAGKIERYEAYFAELFNRDPLFRGFERSPLVLTVTTSERRLGNLIDATRQIAASDRYLFTTLATALAIDPRPLLVEPVWRRSSDEAAITLVSLL